MIEWCKIHSSTLFLSIFFIIVLIIILLLMVFMEDGIKWLFVFISAIMLWLSVFNFTYSRETENYNERLKKKQYIQQIDKKMTKIYLYRERTLTNRSSDEHTLLLKSS